MVKSSVSETAVEFRYYGKREFGGIIQDQKKELVKWREYSGMGGRLPRDNSNISFLEKTIAEL